MQKPSKDLRYTGEAIFIENFWHPPVVKPSSTRWHEIK
jgi:hypothetical protein